MHGYKKKHKEMWQFIIDSVDDIFNYYIEGSNIEGLGPEDVLIDYKQLYIDKVDPDKDILFNCYACDMYSDTCNDCPICKNIGSCTYSDSAFHTLLHAIEEGDKDEFIRQARRIRDAWK